MIKKDTLNHKSDRKEETKIMPLKKRMFRSNMMILFAALLSLLLIVVFALVFCVTLAVGVGVSAPEVWTVAVAVLLATLASMSVHIAQQWEKVVVLRFGTFNRVSGPGLFGTIPVVESNALRVDCRVRATTFGAEETLTADLVPLEGRP